MGRSNHDDAQVLGPTRTALDPAPGRQLATAGIASIACCVVLIVMAHVLDPTHGPVHHMISDYALGPAAAVFDTAVVLLAAGSVTILVALVRGGVLSARAPATALLAGWCASMVVVVLFPPCDCAVQPTVSGAVHGSASLVGFLALPLAARRAAATWAAHPRWRSRARAVRWCASACLVAMAPLAMAVVALLPDVHVWVELPLGLIQRGLVVIELMLLLLLGCWARGGRHRQPLGTKSRQSRP